MKTVFQLELVSLVRSKAFILLSSISLLLPILIFRFVRTDGTADGGREIQVYYSLIAVFVAVFISLAAAAASSISCERHAKRLQLSLVRPISYFKIALGRILALVSVGAISLFAAFAVIALVDPVGDCRHLFRPKMISPRVEAEKMYRHFIAARDLPKEVRAAKKSEVLKLLERKAYDNYQSIPSNTVARWNFSIPSSLAGRAAFLRIRFSDSMSMRRDVKGFFVFGERKIPLANITQAVVEIPFGTFEGKGESVEFRNEGSSSLMLRPRRDIELLVEADSRLFNYFRAWLVSVAILASVVSFGVFLGSCLSRPVAVWTVLSLLFLSVASPAVVEQYPIELNISRSDAMGLGLSAFVEKLTSPVNGYSPLTKLSGNECVELKDVLSALFGNAAIIPLAMSLLSALAMKRVKL